MYRIRRRADGMHVPGVRTRRQALRVAHEHGGVQKGQALVPLARASEAITACLRTVFCARARAREKKISSGSGAQRMQGGGQERLRRERAGGRRRGRGDAGEKQKTKRTEVRRKAMSGSRRSTADGAARTSEGTQARGPTAINNRRVPRGISVGPPDKFWE